MIIYLVTFDIHDTEERKKVVKKLGGSKNMVAESSYIGTYDGSSEDLCKKLKGHFKNKGDVLYIVEINPKNRSEFRPS